MRQLKSEAHDLLVWLDKCTLSTAIVTGLPKEEVTLKPSGDYVEYSQEEQPCAKCKNGVVTVTVEKRVLDIKIKNSDVITAESFFNMSEYGQEAYVSLKKSGYLKPLYKRMDMDNDGNWDILVKLNIDTGEYEEVLPDKIEEQPM